MGILKSFKDGDQRATQHSLKGKDLQAKSGASAISTLHFQSSINNDPAIKGKSPSRLDLDAKTPNKYTNPETGKTFN